MAVFTQMSKITDFLYLSGVAAVTENKLRLNGITNVINVTLEVPGRRFTGIEFRSVHVDDIPTANLSAHFDHCADYIRRVKEAGGRVLVHCVAGVSRSASICIAYFMKHEKLTLKEAHQYVKTRRFIIRPNPGFWRQLVAYEANLFGKNTVVMVKSPIGWIPDVYEDQTRNMVGLPPRKPAGMLRK